MSKIGKWKRSERVTGLMTVVEDNSLREYDFNIGDRTRATIFHTLYHARATCVGEWKIAAYVNDGANHKRFVAKKTFPWERGNPPRELVAEMKAFAEKFYEAMVHKVQEESKTL